MDEDPRPYAERRAAVHPLLLAALAECLADTGYSAILPNTVGWWHWAPGPPPPGHTRLSVHEPGPGNAGAVRYEGPLGRWQLTIGEHGTLAPLPVPWHRATED